MENIPLDNSDQPEFEDSLIKAHADWTKKEEFISQNRAKAREYINHLVICMSPSHQEQLCTGILKVTEDEVWMKTNERDACLVMKNGIWANLGQLVESDTPKKMGGILPLMKEAVKNEEKSNKKTNVMSEVKTEVEKKVIVETAAGKHVPVELLERALTMWYKSHPVGAEKAREYITNEFFDVFPEISFQIIGNEVKLL